MKIHRSGASGSEGAGVHGEAPLGRRAFLRFLAGRALIAGSAFAAGFAIDALWARLVRGPGLARPEYPRLILGEFRIHHSLVGYAAVVVGLVYYPLVLIPLGLGIVVGHGRRDRWGFLERVERP